jgi:hypothetical protein
VDHAGNRADGRGGTDEGLNRFARRHIDHGRGDVETGVEQNVGGGFGILLTQIGQYHVLARADTPGDGQPDRPGADDNGHIVAVLHGKPRQTTSGTSVGEGWRVG